MAANRDNEKLLNDGVSLLLTWSTFYMNVNNVVKHDSYIA